MKNIVDHLLEIPVEDRDYSTWYYLVKVSGYNIRYMTKEMITQDIVNLAFKTYTMTIMTIPDKFKSYSLCKESVKKIGLLLKYVPNKLKTVGMCSIAVNETLLANEFVPDNIKELL